MALILTDGLNITPVKLIVVGEPGVGKTSLIRTMKEGIFREPWDEWGEDLVRKTLYWPDEKISLQMGELHLDDFANNLLPSWTDDAQACLLLYDSDETAASQQIKEKWYSLVNRHFGHVPLFLIRTKADQTNERTGQMGKKLRQDIHAVRFFKCSAKMGQEIEETFVEIVKYLQTIKKRHASQEANDPLNAKTSWGAIGSLIANSGPLLRQTFSNIRECITNPLAFAEQKRAIQCCFPLLSFGVKEESKQDSDEEEILCSNKESSEKIPKNGRKAKKEK